MCVIFLPSFLVESYETMKSIYRYQNACMHMENVGYDMYFCITATKERSIIFPFLFTKRFFLKVSKRMPNVMFQQDMYLHIFAIMVSLISYFTKHKRQWNSFTAVYFSPNWRRVQPYTCSFPWGTLIYHPRHLHPVFRCFLLNY